MKANHLSRWRLSLLVPGAALLSACAVPRVIPPAPAPVPVIVAPPRLAPSPGPPTGWRDLPITPGAWSWQLEETRSAARYGTPGKAPLVKFTCDRGAGQVLLGRPASGAEIPGAHVPMSIFTTTGTRPLSSEPAVSEPGWVTTAIRSTDPILDAMAFSRGRFALETAGLPMLLLPSWPEISRVIEDCRQGRTIAQPN